MPVMYYRTTYPKQAPNNRQYYNREDGHNHTIIATLYQYITHMPAGGKEVNDVPAPSIEGRDDGLHRDDESKLEFVIREWRAPVKGLVAARGRDVATV